MDTDVWSPLFTPGRKNHPAIDRWRALLIGRTVVIAEQTRAEVIGGMLAAGLGSDRSRRTVDQLRRTPTVPVDNELAETCGRLFAECKRVGHALQDKVHTGDRWIAATAIHLGVPLLANDAIYRNTPGLTLLENENAGD